MVQSSNTSCGADSKDTRARARAYCCRSILNLPYFIATSLRRTVATRELPLLRADALGFAFDPIGRGPNHPGRRDDFPTLDGAVLSFVRCNANYQALAACVAALVTQRPGSAVGHALDCPPQPVVSWRTASFFTQQPRYLPSLNRRSSRALGSPLPEPCAQVQALVGQALFIA